MYNPKLKLYSVKQVNVSENRNHEGPLNEVVDPNTEFQTTTSSLVPASALESYGVLTPPSTPGLRRFSDAIQRVQCSSPNFASNLAPLNGSEKNITNQEWRRSESLEIPQVHAYISNTKMDINGISNRIHDTCQPMIHGVSSGKMTKKPSSRTTIFTEKRSSQNVTNVGDVKSDQKIQEAHILFPVNVTVNSTTPYPERSFLTDERSVASGTQATTAEQLAWAFRTARDRLETASNASVCSSRFEMESNCSDRAETMSSFSDVSGYEEELFRIRRLLLQDSSNSYLDKHLGHHSYDVERKYSTPFNVSGDGKDSIFEVYKANMELQIQRLNSQLQIALADKEKVRLELNEVATKSTLESQQKYQDVLRQKANTEGRLEIVQTEVESLRRSLLGNNKKGRESVNMKLQQDFRDIQVRNQEQNMQLELAEAEINRWKEEAQEMDVANERLRIQLQELRLDSESKDGAIQSLKIKVANQHVELQSLLQAKLKAENSTASTKNEVEAIRKSEHWYREQLHACQAAKVKVQQELMTSQGSVVTFKHLVDKLKGETVHLQSIVEETQQRAVREKDTLMRKLEMIHADMLEREAAILGQMRREDTSVDAISGQLRSIENRQACESNIITQELGQQVATLKHELESRDANMTQLGSENAQLLMRITTIQKTLNDKELALQSLETKYRNMEMSFNTANENLRNKDHMLIEVKNAKVIVEVALAAAAREKTEVDAAIEKLRDDFARITKSYQAMKEELRAKEREVLALETSVRESEKIKEQQKEKISSYRNIEEELRETRVIISEVNTWEQRLKSATNKNDELNRKIRESNETKDYALAQVDKLKEMLTFREEQLFNQTQNFEVHTEVLKSRDQLISSLESDKTILNDSLFNSKERIGQLEQLNLNQTKEIDIANAQLSRYNFVIEQFNSLCRGSEEEKHQLKQLLKDLESTEHPLVIKAAIATQTDSSRSSTVNNSSQTPDMQLIPCKDSTSVQHATRDQAQYHIKEIEQLKCSLRMSDVEKRDKQRRYETNIRTLLKKVKEHMRGRKTAEKALEEFRTNSESSNVPLAEANLIPLQLEVDRLEAEIEVARRQYSELKKITEKSEEAVLELEKEKGKLSQTQDGNTVTVQNAEKVKDMEVSEHVDNLEEQIRKQQIIIKELRKQVFVEKRDNSQLRKQVSSLRMGLDTATDVLDNKKIDLGRSEAMGEVLQDAIARLHRDLELEQVLHETCKQDMEKMKRELEEAKAKDPMLADQIKMLSYHLHEKNQEASNLREQIRLCEERWVSAENGFKHSIAVLKEDVATLRGELESVCKDKFALQAQAVELRTGLQSSLDQNKFLRLKVEAYNCTSNSESGLPDLMSSLPSAPVKYNEVQIAELLRGSTALPSNKPLNNLQSCLDSLKQEMETLQQQLAAKTSAQSAAKIGTVSNGNGLALPIVKEI